MTVACSHGVAAWNRVCLVGSGAASILLSPLSHDCDQRLRHRLRLQFGEEEPCIPARPRLPHRLSPLRSSFLSVSLHLAGIRMCALSCGEAPSDIPAETTDVAVHPPRPNRPSQGRLAQAHARRLRAYVHASLRALFI